MSDPDIVPLKLSKAHAAKIVKEIAADADKIVPVKHAKARMAERKISITQIRNVVKAGYIESDPWMDEKGFWRVDMIGRSAGDQIKVGIAIEWRTRLLAITVFELS